jgi:hypothetical protein
MKRRFILYRRKRGGMFYVEDTESRPATTVIVLNIGFPPVVLRPKFKPSAHPNIRWWRTDHECRRPYTTSSK